MTPQGRAARMGRKEQKFESVPFGIRHNNPGNLIFTRDQWHGLDNPPVVKNTLSGRTFFRFKKASSGLRAIVVTLMTYSADRVAKDGSPIDTVDEICQRWDEENGDNYANVMSQATGIPRKAVIDLMDWTTMRKVLCAIVRMENGCQPYDDATLDRAMLKAGMDKPDVKPLKKSRTMAGGLLAGWGAILVAAQDLIQDPEQLGWFSEILKSLPVPTWVQTAIILVGVGLVLYARIDDRNKELR